jgi:hypothetical protein
MPGSETTYLRIFCICGQKMRVSDAMFGAPGKCIACRQKIRIPRAEEIPSDTKEIWLKDHPEFLRNPQRGKEKAERKRKEPAVELAEEREETTFGDEKERLSTVPLDVLDPLIVLCSLEHKIQRRLVEVRRRIRDGEPNLTGEKSKYKEIRATVREARSDLDDTLRQRLMEVAIELANTQERIAELSLSARVGERDYASYREAIDRLRRRRDRLERKQANIRGWLAVRDVHMAGGYRELPLDNLPAEFATLTLPTEPDYPGPLVDQYVESLRASFLRREHADRKLDEARRMEQDGSVPPEGIEDLRAECTAERARSEATIAFIRGRLQQLDGDYTAETRAIEAQLDSARSALQAGKISRPQFDLSEGELLVAKADLAKTRMLIQRTLSAPGARDVPKVKGTFLGRLAQPKEQGPQIDVVVAVVAAIFVGLAILVPGVGGLRPTATGQSGLPVGFFWGPFLGALAILVTAFVPYRSVRGMILCLVWFILFVGSAWFLKMAYASGGKLGEAAQTAGLGQWGVFMYYLGMLLVGGAVFIALMPSRDYRVFPIGAAVAIVLCTWAIATDFGGFSQPRPTLHVEKTEDRELGPGVYTVAITIANTGWRSLALNTESREANTYSFVLERQIGENSWREAGAPHIYEFKGVKKNITARADTGMVITNGNPVTFTFEKMEGGNYRASLNPRNGGREVLPVFFTLEGPESVVAPLEVQQPGNAATPSGALLPQRAEIELRGILGGDTTSPRFNIYVYKAGEEPMKLNLTLRDVVWGDWVLNEHNTVLNTVTIGNGKEIRILQRGERLPVEFSPPPAGTGTENAPAAAVDEAA